MKKPVTLTDMFVQYNNCKNSLGLNLVTMEHLSTENFDPALMSAHEKNRIKSVFEQHMVKGEDLLEALAAHMALPEMQNTPFSRVDLVRASGQVQMEIAVADDYLKGFDPA